VKGAGNKPASFISPNTKNFRQKRELLAEGDI
jgi:hypothetical protein